MLEPAGQIVSEIANRSVAEWAFLKTIQPGYQYNGQALQQKLDNYDLYAVTGQKAIQGAFPSIGTHKALLLLVDYPDQAATNTVAEFDDYCNLPGYNVNGSSGSFRDYYRDISYDSLTVNTDVDGWYTASNNRTYYGYHGGGNYQAARELAREAVDAAEAAGVDFSQYDNDGDGRVDQVMLIHSGNGTEASGDHADMWSHKSSLGGLAVTYDGVEIVGYIWQPERYNGDIANIGVFCHEFGHALGLPDLYDYDGSSSGLDDWCVMSGGTWNNSGKTPSHMSAWCKQELGWSVPTTLFGSGSVTDMGFTDNEAETYRLNTPVPGEYFLVENRQQVGWDTFLDGDGLAIFHIDESAPDNTNEWNPIVSMRQADGLFDLQNDRGDDDGDPYPGFSGNTVFDGASTPNSNTYNGNTSTVDINNVVETGQLMSFNYSATALPSTVTRGPYLQSGTPTSTIIKWRTMDSTDSKVWYGSDPANLTQTETIAGNFIDHEVTISSLTDNTIYYYAVGDSGGQMEGGDSSHYFKTAPVTGTSQPVTTWILGDCGTGNSNQQSVRDAYYNYIGNDHTDMILLLGDNAYNSGLDTEYEGAIFDMYPAKLTNTMMWACPGNHDYIGNSGLNADYYDIFSLPENGEAGGLASNTEKYYSFDYGNIHIISLDSHDESRSVGSPMLTWLENDLAATLQDWIVVIFHHPPYSKGSHDSDNAGETRMVQMRENVLPICEDYGVDLVLSGHSHAYERSKLIHGHYDFSNTYNPATHDVDGGDGRLDGNGAYVQNVSEEGTVYIVTGSAGKLGSVGSHPVMYYSASQLGSTILEVDGAQMDVKFLNNSGIISDYLTLTQNGFPQVNWTAPTDQQIFTDLDTITFLANASDNGGSITEVKFFVNGDSVGVDAVAPFSMDWKPTAFGNFTLKTTATDNEGNISSSEISITIQNSPYIHFATTVSSSTDDAEEEVSNGAMDLSSTDLELIRDGATAQIVGMRFNNIDIPDSTTIANAYIQFTVDETDSGTTDLTIKGEAHDNAPTFSGTAFDISDRTLSDSSVNWSPVPWAVVGAAGADQQTPDLSAIVQEIINRPGWEANNSMAFAVTGSGERTAESFNGDATAAPVLHILYELPGGNSFPMVNWVEPVDGQVFTDFSLDSLKVTATDSDGTLTPLEFYVDSLLVGVDSTPPYALNWLPPTYGQYILKVVATDNKGSSTTKEISITVQNGTTHTISVQINSGNDDAEERISDGDMDLTSTDLELITDGSDAQEVGLRFNNVNIPFGAAIDTAYIQFTTDESQTEPTNLTIHGEAVDSAAAFTSTDFDVSSRTTTMASTDWSPPGWTTVNAAGTDQQTPNLDTVVQEVIDRPGWKTNNPMAFIITGTGHRTADSFNGSVPARAAILHVTYTVGANFCAPYTDADDDGYCSHIDCDDNDPSINPDATEICNGLDDDCNGLPEATITTWTGDGGNLLWTDAANWSDGWVPLPCQEVVLPNGFQVVIPAGEIGVGKMLEVELGAELETVPMGEMDVKN